MRYKDTDSDIKTLISGGRLFAFQRATASRKQPGSASDFLRHVGEVPSSLGPAGLLSAPPPLRLSLHKVPGMGGAEGQSWTGERVLGTC